MFLFFPLSIQACQIRELMMYPNFGRVFEPYFIMRRYLFYLSLFFWGRGGRDATRFCGVIPTISYFAKSSRRLSFPLRRSWSFGWQNSPRNDTAARFIAEKCRYSRRYYLVVYFVGPYWGSLLLGISVIEVTSPRLNFPREEITLRRKFLNLG